jgi:NAD dependent epimerase/dehydratase family enzyme
MRREALRAGIHVDDLVAMILAALGEMARELLGSRRAIPARATELGFHFRIDSLARALEAELH